MHWFQGKNTVNPRRREDGHPGNCCALGGRPIFQRDSPSSASPVVGEIKTVSENSNQRGFGLNPRVSPPRASAGRRSDRGCDLLLRGTRRFLCVKKKETRRRVSDGGARSAALRACSALNEWKRRTQCLLDKPTPIGHSLH